MKRDNRTFYHPLSTISDLVRKNMFELIIGSGHDPLRILCKTITLQHPKSNAVQVPWMGGVMQLAGRISSGFTFNASFLVGTDNSTDTLKELYQWREQAFDHITGRISLANVYKESAEVIIYDVTGGEPGKGDTTGAKYIYKIEGLWPTEITDISFGVDQDDVLEIQAAFAADKIYMEFPNS